jgi:hypothetical protein
MKAIEKTALEEQGGKLPGRQEEEKRNFTFLIVSGICAAISGTSPPESA